VLDEFEILLDKLVLLLGVLKELYICNSVGATTNAPVLDALSGSMWREPHTT